MTRIIAEISVSLDGFVTGPDLAAPRAHRAGRRDTSVHRRSAAHAGAAERDLDIDRDAPDLRRLPVIR